MHLLVLFTLISLATGENQEPQLGDYFATEIPRVSNLTPAEFEKLSVAGRPFVVTDLTAQSHKDVADWTCDSIRSDFAQAKMRQEYTAEGSDEDTTAMADASWMTASASSGAHRDQAAPQLAPFYWGVKEGSNPAMLKKIQSYTRIPYFMDEKRNKEEIMGSPELWFSRPGAGAKAHMDNHCESTMSIQLDGTKLWRLSPPAATTSFLRDGTYFDGGVYNLPGGWNPLYTVNLSKGEALFFPPSFIHESKNVGDGCAASITYQYSHPMAAGMFRAFWPRLRRTGDMNECWAQANMWATLGRDSFPHGDLAAAKTSAQELFADSDQNSDGKLELNELGGNRNYLGYHDTNQDGAVSLEEFVNNFMGWSHTEHLLREANPLRSKELDAGDGSEDEQGSEEERDDI